MYIFKLFTFGMLLLMLTRAEATYRVYQYSIKATNPYNFDPRNYTVISTLDPVSYLAYHGSRESMQIDLLRSWMCQGYTGKKKTCLPPLEEINESF